MRVLLIEDDPMIGRAVSAGLQDGGYAVDWVRDGGEAELAIANGVYDLALLDLGLPRRDGMDILKSVRRSGTKLPVLVITARDSVADRVAGLDAGADDYLTKPFAFGELLARLRALLRRRAHEVLPPVLAVGDLEVDTRRQSARRGDRPIALTAKEYAFLEYLARHAGRVVSRAELTEHVWDDNHDPAANLIDVYVSRLRRKVDGGGAPPLVHTRRGAGVMLGADAGEGDD